MIRQLAVIAMLVAAVTASPISKKLKPKEDLNYRLPGDINPNSYNIRLVPYLDGEGDKSFTFDGEVVIRVQTLKDVSTIVLHSSELVISEEDLKVIEIVDGNEGDPVTVTLPLETDDALQFLKINLESPLPKFKTYDIHLKYSGKLNEEMRGFYKSSYAQGDSTIWLATTQFESTDARKAFPCFDEPSMKAKFDIAIARKENQNSLSNMPRRGDPSGPDDSIGGRVWDTYETTPVMSTYLVAFIVSEFEAKQNEDKNFGVWARKDALPQGQYAMDVGPGLLSHLRDFLGISYEVPKVDNVAISDFSAGAMENWGLVTYREASLLFEEGVSTELNRQRVARVIGHEFAHFWFGDLVTLGWWEYAWLNEGFASYFEVLSVDWQVPQWEILDHFLVDTVQSAMLTDSLTTALQLSQPCSSPAEIDANFGSITYDKGGSVLRMLDNVLSTATFQKGLQGYLTEFQHTGVKPDDLFNELDKAALTDNALDAGVTVKEFMSSWTLKPGFPYIKVSGLADDPSTLVISQERVLLHPDTANPDTSLWWIPLSWTRKSEDSELAFEDTKPKAWMKAEKKIIIQTDIAEDEWIIFNNKQTGFYRVAYDTHYWSLIIKTLQSEQFTTIKELNRAQIVNDALNLARSGVIGYENALDATTYLKDEVAYAPWVSAFNGFDFLDTKLVSSNGFEAFKSYVLQSMDTLYQTLTFDFGNDESQKTVLNRVNALKWACKYGLSDCVDHALTEFKDWQADTNKRVQPNKKSVVYCTALRDGPTENWDFLWSQYLAATVSADQNTILAALGCTNDENTLNSYLQKSITDDSGIRLQDAPSVFSAVYNNPEGVDVALDFLVENLPAINSHYLGFNTLGSAIQGLAGKLTTQAQVDKLKAFVDSNEEILGTTSAYIAAGRAIEAAEADLEWADANAGTILDWMQKHGDSGTANLQATSIFVLISAFVAYTFNRR